jgi:DNA-binding XRE family transcriptional regulator
VTLYMKKYFSSLEVLSEVGSRIKAYRIDSALTQEMLALKAGVSSRSIQYLESGYDVKFSTLIKVLMALSLDTNIDMLVPDPKKRPSYYINIKNNSRRRFRASKKNEKNSSGSFKWGDDS